MKQILKILTTFISALGLWAAILVGVIVIYPQMFGRFNSSGASSGKAESPLITNITAADPQPLLNQEPYLALNEDSLSNTEPLTPARITDLPLQSDTVPATVADPADTAVASTATPIDTTNDDIYTIPIAPETSGTVSTAPVPVSSDRQTQNENNFNTYNNSDQQQTNDTFVLNTSTLKIHYPNCNYVKKIAPENYSTSNLSIDELKLQGYSTCGHCF